MEFGFVFLVITKKTLVTTFFVGLHYPRSLNLSDYELLEGALPIYLASLSSLQSLDLSRNSFITMPSSLIHLSELRKLMLKHCKSLRSLRELPSSIETLDCDYCTSIETFSCPSTAYRSKMLERLKDSFEPYVGLFIMWKVLQMCLMNKAF